jgi:hypothetical protein
MGRRQEAMAQARGKIEEKTNGSMEIDEGALHSRSST